MTTIRLTVAAIALALCGVAVPARGGDGFPPFGAWAYGTGSPSYAVGHHATWRHPHFSAYTYRGRPAWGHVGWSRYGYSRYAVRQRVYGVGLYGVGLYGAGYGSRAYANAWGCHGSYAAYYPVVNIPSYYYYQTYSYPTYHYAPACVWPGVVSVGSVNYTTSLPANRLPVAVASHSPVITAGTSNRQQLASAIQVAADTSSSSRLVSLEPAMAATADIPDSLLAAADAIFQAGGYRQAATAYAQLDVRYGSSDLILGRRFIAQVASGDVEQAAVIVSLAELAGRNFQQVDLPGGNLDQLFAHDPAALTAATERLAARALARADEAEPLQTIGRWLQLVGDVERASMFLQMAERLSATEQLDPPAMPITKSELVSLE